MVNFIKELKNYRGLIPKNTLKTIRGQALAGDIEGAEKGLKKAVEKYKKMERVG